MAMESTLIFRFSKVLNNGKVENDIAYFRDRFHLTRTEGGKQKVGFEAKLSQSPWAERNLFS